MSNNSKTKFIATVKKSGVINADRLKEWLQATDAQTLGDLAKYLVRDELLTKWQAKYLLSGRSRLDIASYRLLDRTSRNELGDRFLAVHTSLARKVNLQVFPPEVTKDESRCKPFLKKASHVAKLDHPNLVHVYDIDQEGGRYCLITEHVEGTTVDKFPRSKITENVVARILNEALKGIRHAHDNDVVHGCLRQSDMILVDAKHLKIQNLAISPLRQDSKASPAEDFKAIRNIGVSLLKEIPSDKRTEKYRQLAKILNAFDPKDSATAKTTSAALTRWVDAADPAEETSEVDLASNGLLALDFPQDSSDPLAGVDQQVAGTAASPARLKKKNTQQKEAPQEELAEPGMLGRMWKKNPVAVIATAAVLLLGLIGGSVVGAYTYLNSTDPVAAVAKSVPQKTVASHEGDQGNTEPANQPNKNSTTEKNEKDDGDVTKFAEPILKSAIELGSNNIKVPAGTMVKFLGAPAGGFVELEVVLGNDQKLDGWVETSAITEGKVITPLVVKTASPEEPPTSEAEKEDATTEPDAPPKPGNTDVAVNRDGQQNADDLTQVSGIGEAMQKHLLGGDVKTMKQLAGMSISDVQVALTKGGWKTPNKLEEYKKWVEQAKKFTGDTSPIKASVATSPPPQPKVEDLSKPFKKFPRVTDLPAITDTKEFKIAPLKINPAFLLGAEMVCEDGVHRSKLIFELVRSSEDKQKWMVEVKRRAKEKPEVVGAFRKSEDSLFFQWLPEAVESKYAEYLRNCYLKLKTPDGKTHFLTLRKPIRIADLRYTAENMRNIRAIEIPAMPSPKNIVMELIVPRVKNLQLNGVRLGIEPDRPGIIALKKHDSKDAFMWIQVEGELRSKLKLRASVKAKYGARVTEMADLNDVSNFISALKRDTDQLGAMNQAKQQEQPKNDQKSQLASEKSEYNKRADQARSAFNKAIEYKDILTKAANKPIEVRVYAKFGNLQTQLIVCDPKIPQPVSESGKKKKKKK